MGALTRTASYLSLPGIEAAPPLLSHTSSSSSLDCSTTIVMQHHKEQRRRRRRVTITQGGPNFTISSNPAPSLPKPTKQCHYSLRASSPLAPCQKLLPPRASFPHSKHEPDLYKVAITTRMRCSPEGQKILTMGPRLAVSIMNATRELERIVAGQMMDADPDYPMRDGTLGNSWIVVPARDDWEMVECS